MATGMAVEEEALAKVTLEVKRLEKDAKMHGEAVKMSQACNSLVESVKAADEPLAMGYVSSNGTNAFIKNAAGGCAVM